MNSNTLTPGAKDAFRPAAVSSNASACISQGIKIKGEVSGTEDLFIDGQIEGKLSFANAVVTVGPNASVKADIVAREIVVRGRIDGKLTGSEKIQVWGTARVNGDLKSERISIEEGAELHGQMEAGKSPLATSNTSAPKKLESSKLKDAASGEERTSSGAAVAGAD
jgi:cytoskeletal protein CcmA (bactofilin family)